MARTDTVDRYGRIPVRSMGARHASRSAAEEAAAGRETRHRVPIDRLGRSLWVHDRPDPVTLLENQGSTRDLDLLPVRFGRMLTSPFAFYRGAAAIMAADLTKLPNTGFQAQVCGDAHVANFGGFVSPEHTIVFELNDFDETLPGPWEWDVKRLATSLEIAGRQGGLSDNKRRGVVRAAAGAYQSAMREFAESAYLDVWYARPDTREIARRWGDASRFRTGSRLDSPAARFRDNQRAYEKLSETRHGEVRLRNTPPIVQRVDDLMPADEAALYASAMQEILRAYAESLSDDRRRVLDKFAYRDVARKVVGVGSIGLRTSVVLLVGRETSEPLVLQVKEAGPSVLEPYLGRSAYSHHGRRVVEGQRLMQGSSDILLGWVRGAGMDGVVRDYYIRQLWDWRIAPEIESMTAADLNVMGRMCAWTLAHAHARTASRIAIAAYLGDSDRFATAIDEFSVAYGDQNQRDYESLLAAADRGRIIEQAGA